MSLVKYNQNILWLYVYTFLSGLYFDRALWVLYLAERGLNMGEVGLLEALLHLTIFLFEVPTGIIADLYGRKVSLIIGQFISLFYAVFMYLNGHMYIFTLAFALLGLSLTFKSGADQAFLYDSLTELNKEKKYTKILGNQTAIVLISFSLAKLVGGFMAELDWRIVYFGIFLTQFIGIIPLFMLKEPTMKEVHDTSDKFKNKLFPYQSWKKQLNQSLSLWKKEPSLRYPALLYLMVMTEIVVMIFYAQEYLSRLGFSESEIGIIFMLESLFGVLAAKVAYRVEKRWPSRKIIKKAYYVFILALIFFAFTQKWIAVILLFILGMISELMEPIFSNFLQMKIESKVRATVFSVMSLLNSLAIMIFFPIFGILVDLLDFQFSILLLSMPMIFIILIFRKENSKTL